MIDYLTNNPNYYQLDAYTWERDDFRAMEFGPWITSQKEIDYDVLTSLMVEHEYTLPGTPSTHALRAGEHRAKRYDLAELKKVSEPNERLLAVKPVEYKKLRNAYRIVFEDLKYFPIPFSTNPETPAVTYGNGWLDKRTYGGDRGHEGCDLMGTERERGYYPVVSITDGVVEKVGWLEKGGWRIGIRSPSGTYFYYAHLYKYSKEWKEGDTITAGQLLGFMGDSGYSTVEGTVGNFDVHLHLGIYLKTDHYEEMSINPYWILRYLEQKRLTYWY